MPRPLCCIQPLGHNRGKRTVKKKRPAPEPAQKSTPAGTALRTEPETIPPAAHTDAEEDNRCDVCGKTIKEVVRRGMRPFREEYRNIPIAGWFLTVMHFFVPLAQSISHWI